MNLYEMYMSQSADYGNHSFCEHREHCDWTTDWAEYIDDAPNDSDDYDDEQKYVLVVNK